MTQRNAHEEIHDHDLGLSHDLPRLLSRRSAFAVFGGLAAVLVGCTADDGGTSSQATTSAAGTTLGSATPSDTSTGVTDSGTTAPDGSKIPEETGGPYPADGSNGVNVLTESGIVRSDITGSFGSADAVAEGILLKIRLRILNTAAGSSGYEGAAVYLWHCDRDGQYSLYSQGIAEQNYLRGVQAADGSGWVNFTSIYPAAYSGRWPHIHFEVYPDLAAATTASGKLRTTQLALPEETNNLVYATDGYEQSVENLARSSLDTDNVFRDGYSLQLATITGAVSTGLTATLNVPV